MHGVSGAIGNHSAQNLLAYKRKVANQVENFVTHEFIGKAQRWIHQPITRKHYAVLRGGASYEALLAHRVGLVKKAEGAGGGDLRNVVSIRQINAESLFADE